MGVSVRLEIFEGPLDLLLHLIRKNEVDIYDIPIALITRQYLEYLDLMREMNISLAGDFLVMAATLTHIKSRTLLPSHDPNAEDEDEDDPMVDLVAQLKEHMRLKAAARELEQLPRLERDIFNRGGGREELEEFQALGRDSTMVRAGLFDLIEAFHRVMNRRGRALNLALPKEGISIEDRMSQILELLKTKDSLTFEEIFEDQPAKGDMVVTFLALLEIARLGFLRVYQLREDTENGEKARWGVLRLYYNPPGNEEDA